MVNIITAVGDFVSGKGYPIGKKGKMPWHNSADLKWFKETTMGHAVIMGKNTWKSIGEKPLPGRHNIVVTNHLWHDSCCSVCGSVEEAIECAKKYDDEIFIIGGATIYKYALEHNLVDRIYVDMLANRAEDADTFFPGNIFGGDDWETFEPIEIEKGKAYAVTSVKKKMEIIEMKGVHNHVDDQYLNLVNDIIENGQEKDTRAGKTRSVFGRQLRFNLQEGLPMLTTKKMFSRGVIHELLWFLKGDTNIKYLVDNGVHIWDDDAYRYYLELVAKENEWRKGKFAEDKDGNPHELKPDVAVDKELFLKYVKLGATHEFIHKTSCYLGYEYHYGDLSRVYGAQWTNWGGHNQVQEVIETLKKNPDDRRMIISAWNVAEIPDMALPPCHYCCQFYTTKMTHENRINWLLEHAEEKNLQFTGIDVNELTVEDLDDMDVPARKLSCCFHMRGTDCICGLPFNVTSYSILTHMIAQCVNMDVDELIYEVGDAHVYENHIEIYNQIQKNRNPHIYALPKLVLNQCIKNIEDFTYDDIKIEGYQSYPSIKYPLNTGLDKIN